MLTPNHIRHFCMGDGSPGSGCRYLERDDLDDSKFYCLKLVESRRRSIDEEMDADTPKRQRSGGDEVMLGDNCQGYIKLKSIWQGYDVK